MLIIVTIFENEEKNIIIFIMLFTYYVKSTTKRTSRLFCPRV